ncbi:hypothetical protein F5Y15DRAFT_361670 [Xylariaceae sp. FL0016]|nr:hypothetical protein F5Y15DRAFT_361670 [Xylariaceae sp. FL0016]
MSLSPTSQCCRAVRHRLRPRFDAVWALDSPLPNGLDRYCDNVHIVARYGSSVPGPMENRRRLGKRHMGELNLGHSHGAAPLWSIEDSVDLTQWSWKPPKVSSLRLKYDTVSESSQDFMEAFYSWLRGPSSPCGVAAPVPIESLLHVGSSLKDLVQVGTERLLQDLESNTSVESMADLARFCRVWACTLEESHFASNDICAALDSIIEALDASATGDATTSIRENVKIRLYEATIEAMSRTNLRNPAQFDQVVWSRVLHKVSELQQNNLQIFGKAMTCIPEHQYSTLTSGILANLVTQLQRLEQAAKPSTMARQTKKMAKILSGLGSSDHRPVLNVVVQKVQSFSQDVNYTQLRLSLMMFLAKLPSLDYEFLAEACKTLEEMPGSEPFSNAKICHFFLAHAHSRGSLGNFQVLLKRIQHNEAQCLHRLTSRLWADRRLDLVKDLIRLFVQLGRERDLPSIAKGMRVGAKGDFSALASLAVAMRRPSVAIRLLACHAEDRDGLESFWRSSLSTEILGKLLRVRGLQPRELLDRLGIFERSPTRPPGHWTRRRISYRLLHGAPPQYCHQDLVRVNGLKAAKVAIVIAHCPGIARGMAFKSISRCYRYICGLPVTSHPQIYQALLHITTRDLAEGRPGIASRLRYVLFLLRKRFGHDEMVRTGLALKRWSTRNRERYRGRRRHGLVEDA